tara:strand:+ start:376 stop:1371 length:996 start_codon:yes stop_codon:yes gene_type:complete
LPSDENNHQIKTVLLVGASGYIGRHVAQRLLQKEYNVISLYRKVPELERPPRNKQVTNLVVDLNNKDELKTFSDSCPPFDAVISCLGSRTGGIQDSWNSEYLVNLNILRLALKRSAKKFVLLSAICVQKPRLHFQRAKLAMENELIHSRMAYTIIRPTAFFKSLAGQVDRVKSGRKFITFDNGEITSCKPISERDLAEFICSSLTNPKMENKILPIGGPSPAITPLDQGNLLFNLTGKKPKFLRVPSNFLKVLQTTLAPLSYFSSSFRDRIEFLRIAHYYATESMLYWENESIGYSSEKTPEFGTESLKYFYMRVLKKGLDEQDLGSHKLF